jgi:hypothetical protein
MDVTRVTGEEHVPAPVALGPALVDVEAAGPLGRHRLELVGNAPAQGGLEVVEAERPI